MALASSRRAFRMAISSALSSGALPSKMNTGLIPAASSVVVRFRNPIK